MSKLDNVVAAAAPHPSPLPGVPGRGCTYEAALRLLVGFACIFSAVTLDGFAHDSIPGPPQKQPIAIVGGTVYPVSSEPIEKGIVLFDKGRIVAVGKEAELPPDSLKIDAAGKRVYPGLFDAHTNLGLIEIPSVRATVDEREVGLINPNVEAIKAVHPDSELIPVTRSNGVLLALTAPDGPLLAGRCSVIQLDGWTWEDMSLRGDAAMRLVWPIITPVRNLQNPLPLKKQIELRDEQMKALNEAFENAAAYKTARDAAQAKTPPDDTFAADARWEAMLPVLTGKQPLLVHAHELQQIQATVAFSLKWKLRLIIQGGYDAPRCAELLKKRDVPVITEGAYRLPLRGDDEYDAPFTLAERLRAAGITFCIAGGGRHATENARNLPYQAAQSVAFGLPADEALKAITLSPAKILGVADRVGSLEVGKDATLFIADGDILDTPTHVERAWIQGREVDLNDRQKRLWNKYREKYKQQEAAKH
jgi:imidazolonepropionase-like amidohydrolase